MVLALSRITRGLVGSIPLDGIQIASRLSGEGVLSEEFLDYTEFKSVANYVETIGTLTLYQLPDGSGVRVTVDRDFPEDFQGGFWVVRGQYEYKTHPSETPLTVLLSDFTGDTGEVVFVDTTISETDVNTHYYYSIVALVGSGDESLHIEYNPATGLGSAYRYNIGACSEYLISRLPVAWVDCHDEFLDNFVSIFGYLFDTIKSDIDTYGFGGNSIDDVTELHLEDLAAIIDWEINRELKETLQRTELKNATEIYQKKGRDNSIEFLIQLITGWEVQFEHGYNRVFREGGRSFDTNDPFLVSRFGAPELCIDRELLGTSTGVANQDFDLTKADARKVIVEIFDTAEETYTCWLEVGDFTGSGSSDEHFTITEAASISTITFGDGVNGAVPVAGTELYASYKYGGDQTLRSQQDTSNWENMVGTRIVLTETATSEGITQVLLDKINKVIGKLQASYAIYKILVLTSHEENVPTVEDSFEDFIETVFFIKMNVAGHQMNNEDYVMPVLGE